MQFSGGSNSERAVEAEPPETVSSFFFFTTRYGRVKSFTQIVQAIRHMQQRSVGTRIKDDNS